MAADHKEEPPPPQQFPPLGQPTNLDLIIPPEQIFGGGGRGKGKMWGREARATVVQCFRSDSLAASLALGFPNSVDCHKG